MAKTARTPKEKRKTLVEESVEDQNLEIENAEVGNAAVEHNEIENVEPENAILEKSVANDDSDEEGQYEIEKVISHHPISATNDRGVKKYTVKWLGYDETDNSMEPKANLAGCEKHIETYWAAKQEETDEQEEQGEQAEIEVIVEHHPKTATDDSGTKKYTVKWAGFCEEDNTIEPKNNLNGCKYLIETYWKAKKEKLMSAKKKTTAVRRASKKSLGNKSVDKKFVGKERKSSPRMQISEVLAAAAKIGAVEEDSEKMEVETTVVPAAVVPLESYNSHMDEPEKMEVTDDKTLFQEVNNIELCNMTQDSIHETSSKVKNGKQVDAETVSQLNFSDTLDVDDELLNSEEIEENIENKDKQTKTPKTQKPNHDIVADSAVILNQLEPSKTFDNENENKITSSAMKKLSINATGTKIKPVVKVRCFLSAPKKRAKMSMPFLLEEMNKGYAEENEFLKNLAEHQDMPTHLSNEINNFLSRYNEEF